MRIRIDLKIFIFLALFYFTNQIRLYLIIMFFCLIHEIGHILMGLILKMKPEKIEIMPFGFSVSFCVNHNKIKELFVVLAGPITSLVLAILCSNIDLIYISTQEAVYSNLLIFLFNMLPIYPLDGGRIIRGILHIILGEIKSEILTNKITNVTIIMITIISSIAVYYYKNFAIFLICIFLWWLAIKEKMTKLLLFYKENSKIDVKNVKKGPGPKLTNVKKRPGPKFTLRKAGIKWQNQQ